jgi:hypothetical protein
MKELILITAHTPDNKRQQLLRNFVNSIKGKGYDIMISSHTFIPKDIMDDIDYFIYNKNNKLLTSSLDKGAMLFISEANKFKIRSAEVKEYNHSLACLELIKFGLNSAKNLNYEKVHFFEYDSIVNGTEELEENSILLDKYNIIYYETAGIQWPNSPMSLNIKEISDLWFDLDNSDYFSFLNKTTSKLCEEYLSYLISVKDNSLKKYTSNLFEKNIKIGIHDDTNHLSWYVPVYNSNNGLLNFFIWSKEDNDLDVMLVVNKNDMHHKIVSTKCWKLFNIGDYDKVVDLVIIVDNKLVKHWDFSKIDKNNFKIKNQIITL